MSTIQKVTGQRYRILVDSVNKVWKELSFKNSASDVEFDDGMTAEEKVGNIKGLTTLKQSQTGYALDSTAAAIAPTVLSGTLYIGSTSLTFTNSAITSTAKINIYSSKYGVNPKDAVVSGNTLTLTFDAQTDNINFRVEVSEF